MLDVDKAYGSLNNHSISLCKDNDSVILDGRGISPILSLIESGRTFVGYSCADVIVGKAAAMLFVKMGVVSVHARVMSRSGKFFLEKNNVEVFYDILTDRIVNRTGDDMCPMEKTIMNIDDVSIAYHALLDKVEEMKKIKNTN